MTHHTLTGRIVGAIDRHPVATIVVWGIVLLLPMLVTGATLLAHDSFSHMQYIKSFADQLGSGDLYPRWVANANAGLGSPTFFFYFPLPYYITSLFFWLEPLDPFAVYRCAVASTLMLILSGLTMRAWLSTHFSRRGALIGALLYMAIPFHLVVDLYIRMAFCQFCAAIFLPLMLYGVDLFRAKRWFAPLVLAAATAGMLTSHLPTSMLFAPVALIYAALIERGRDRVMLVVKSGLAMLLGAALVGIYLIPFFGLDSLINLQITTIGKLNYRNSFLLTTKLFRIEYDSFLGCLVLAWSALGLSWMMSRAYVRTLSETSKRFLRFNVAVVVGSLFMMSTLSLPVWNALPSLQKVQFTQRFLPILSVGLAPLLVVAATAWWKQRGTNGVGKRRVRQFVMPSMLVATLVLTAIFSLKYILGFYVGIFEHRRMPVAKYQFDVSMNPPEYLTIWATRLRPANPDTVEPFIHEIHNAEVPWRMVSGRGEIVDYVARSRSIRFVSRSSEPYTIDLHRFYFAGLVGEVDSGTLSVLPSPGYGLVRVSLPAGERRVSLRLAPTRAERMGQWCSLIALAIAVLIGYLGWSRRRSSKTINDTQRG